MNIRLKDESLAGRYRVHHATKNDCHAATTDSWLEALLAYKTLTQDARNDVVIVTDQEFDREERIYASFARTTGSTTSRRICESALPSA